MKRPRIPKLSKDTEWYPPQSQCCFKFIIHIFFVYFNVVYSTAANILCYGIFYKRFRCEVLPVRCPSCIMTKSSASFFYIHLEVGSGEEPVTDSYEAAKNPKVIQRH